MVLRTLMFTPMVGGQDGGMTIISGKIGVVTMTTGRIPIRHTPIRHILCTRIRTLQRTFRGNLISSRTGKKSMVDRPLNSVQIKLSTVMSGNSMHRTGAGTLTTDHRGMVETRTEKEGLMIQWNDLKDPAYLIPWIGVQGRVTSVQGDLRVDLLRISADMKVSEVGASTWEEVDAVAEDNCVKRVEKDHC